MSIVETPQLQSNVEKVADTIWKAALFGPDNYKSALISHYVYAKNETYKQHALKFANELFADFSTHEVKEELNEDDLQYLIKFPDSFPFIKQDNPQFTFIDLFAGIGGFRLAMQNLQGECVFSSEWDKMAQKTYYANFGEIPFGDITKEEIKNGYQKSLTFYVPASLVSLFHSPVFQRKTA